MTFLNFAFLVFSVVFSSSATEETLQGAVAFPLYNIHNVENSTVLRAKVVIVDEDFAVYILGRRCFGTNTKVYIYWIGSNSALNYRQFTIFGMAGPAHKLDQNEENPANLPHMKFRTSVGLMKTHKLRSDHGNNDSFTVSTDDEDRKSILFLLAIDKTKNCETWAKIKGGYAYNVADWADWGIEKATRKVKKEWTDADGDDGGGFRWWRFVIWPLIFLLIFAALTTAYVLLSMAMFRRSWWFANVDRQKQEQ